MCIVTKKNEQMPINLNQVTAECFFTLQFLKKNVEIITVESVDILLYVHEEWDSTSRPFQIPGALTFHLAFSKIVFARKVYKNRRKVLLPKSKDL